MLSKQTRLAIARIAFIAAIAAGGLTGCGGAEDPEEALREASAELELANAAVSEAEAVVEDRQEAVDAAAEALSEAQKELAEAQSHARDAQAVVAEKATNSALFRAVQRRLLEDEELDGLAIAAEVDGGVVVLRGRVSTPGQRDRAVEVAGATPGVQRVDTKIDVPAPPADE